MLLLARSLRHLPAQPLTGGFLDGGRNLFGLCDRLGLPGFFNDRFLFLDAKPIARFADGAFFNN